MVECHLAKVKVAGPNPVSRSKIAIGEFLNKTGFASRSEVRICADTQGFAPKVAAQAAIPFPAPKLQ